MNTNLLDLIIFMPGLTTDEWHQQFAVRRRQNCDLGIPTDAELVECVDGCWEPVRDRMPVGTQGSLFG